MFVALSADSLLTISRCVFLIIIDSQNIVSTRSYYKVTWHMTEYWSNTSTWHLTACFLLAAKMSFFRMRNTKDDAQSSQTKFQAILPFSTTYLMKSLAKL